MAFVTMENLHTVHKSVWSTKYDYVPFIQTLYYHYRFQKNKLYIYCETGNTILSQMHHERIQCYYTAQYILPIKQATQRMSLAQIARTREAH